MKILKKSTFLRKHSLQNVAILHLLVYCGPILINFSGQNGISRFLDFPPLQNPCFPIKTLKIVSFSGQTYVFNQIYFYIAVFKIRLYKTAT